MSCYFAGLLVAGILVAAAGPAAADPPPLPLGRADLGAEDIVFSSSGDLWVVSRTGGTARPLTEGPGWDDGPVLSPDGDTVVFQRSRGGAPDLYVVALGGGEPRRLTWHPKTELPRDWSADGRRVLFTSDREGDGLWRLYTIGLDDPWEEPLDLPRGMHASWSPDGARLACAENGYDPGWLRYRGGAAPRIWIVDMRSAAVTRIPGGPEGDWQPMWVGDTIYFLSERSGTANLHAYDTGTARVRPVTHFERFGAESAGAGPGGIVLVRHGALWLLPLPGKEPVLVPVTRPLPVMEHLAPHTENVAAFLSEATATADGALVTARGDVFLVDAGGRAVNLTATPGAADRWPRLSPDGRRLAWLTDASGEYRLEIATLDVSAGTPRLTERRSLDIAPEPTFYQEPTWSPDSRRLVVADKHQRLWLVDTAGGGREEIDRSDFPGEDAFQPAFSPDGARLAWSRHVPSRICAVFLREVAGGAVRRVSPDLQHCESPVFSADGRTLYMTSSILSPAVETFGLSSGLYRGLVTRSILAVSLEAGEGATAYRALGAEPRNWAALARNGNGALLARADLRTGNPLSGRVEQTLYRLDPRSGAETKLAEGVRGYSVSPDGGSVLVETRQGRAWVSADTTGPMLPLPVDTLLAVVDRRAEWAQIFQESVRLMRDYFHDAHHHGQDLKALEAAYAPFLPGLVHRRDLTALQTRMFAHVSVSHLGFDGGDDTEGGGPGPRVGLPGADFERVGGRIRIRRILRGDNLSALTTSPLDQAEVGAREGDWLLSVGGVPVDASRNLYSYFEVARPAPVEITFGPDSSGAGARTAAVRLLPGENTLRRHAWAEENRRAVERLSGGRLGYIYLPNTGSRGFELFHRDFFAQRDRKGLVIDERWNSGGAPADLIVEILGRRALSAYGFRDGADVPFPLGVFEGPLVMVVNELAGSGGDTLPWMFRRAGLGPLVGTTTMGAGIGGYVTIPPFVDGGEMAVPCRAFFDPAGEWGIENRGVAPDVAVEILPADWRAGRDPQLERAVALALRALETAKPPVRRRPAEPPSNP